MCRFMDDCNTRIICPRFAALLFLLVFSLVFVSMGNAYYALSGLGSYGSLYGGLGLYGLGGSLYGLGLYGLGGIYGGISGLYGLGGGLYGLSRLYGLGGLYGMGGLYGLSGIYGLGGLYGLGNLGFYGGSYGLGGLGGLLGGLYGLGGIGSLLSSLISSPLTTVAPAATSPATVAGTTILVMPPTATATVSALLPLLPLPVAPLAVLSLPLPPLFIAEQAGTWMGTWTNGLLSGPMTLNLIDALGLISGTAQLLANPTLGSLVDVTGTAINAQITLSGTGVGLGGMSFGLDLVGILTATDTMIGTYSIINLSGGTVVDQGRFNLVLITPVI